MYNMHFKNRSTINSDTFDSDSYKILLSEKQNQSIWLIYIICNLRFYEIE